MITFAKCLFGDNNINNAATVLTTQQFHQLPAAQLLQVVLID